MVFNVECPPESKKHIDNVDDYVFAAAVTRGEYKLSTAMVRAHNKGKKCDPDKLLRYCAEISAEVKKPYDTAINGDLAEAVKKAMESGRVEAEAKKEHKSTRRQHTATNCDVQQVQLTRVRRAARRTARRIRRISRTARRRLRRSRSDRTMARRDAAEGSMCRESRLESTLSFSVMMFCNA